MKNVRLRIVVADDEPVMLQYYQEVLTLLGHEVVAATGSGQQLVDQCRLTQPDLVIADVKMPDLDGIEATHEVCQERPVPVVLVSAYHDAALLERAQNSCVLAYLVKPIKEPDLEPAISLAVRRFREMEALRQEADSLRQNLQDRKVIERAKGIMMKRTGLDEPDAYRRLQKMASDKNWKLVEVAQTIVAANDAFEST